MSKKYEINPINELRRKDRGQNDEWIKEYLHHAAFASIATVNGDRPFINMNIFVYDETENCIYFHTAKEGRTRYNIQNDDKVCLSVSEIGRFLPAEQALELSVEYKSVVVFGKVFLIEEDSLSKAALQKLIDKYFPHLKPDVDYRGIIPEELKRTSVFKIEIELWSGKAKTVSEDFPGAFYYPIENGG